jgi:hypothetical protein
VIAATGTDKKHAAGRLRWVLPTADGTVIRDDVPAEVVVDAVRGVIAGAGAAGSAGSADARGSAAGSSA